MDLPAPADHQLLADLAAGLMVTSVTDLDDAIVAGLGLVAEVAGATAVALGNYRWGTGSEPVRIGALELCGPEPLRPELDEPVRAWVAAAATVLRAAAEHRRALAAAADSTELYRSVLDDVGMVIVRIDGQGKITYINRGWTDLTGIPASEMIGKDPLYFVHPDDRETASAHMVERLSGRDTGAREVRFATADGSERWVEVGGNVIFDESGRPVTMIGVLQDVTDRHQAQEHADLALGRAEQARERAEEASRSKSEFLSRMSHELRTPLNAILGFAQLLTDAPLSEEDADSLAQIERAGRLLLLLVNDALDVARIETGNISFTLEPVAVEPLVAECLDLIRLPAAQRNLFVRAPGATEHKVLADANRLRQVLANLLSNAVKYNVDGGRIDVSCQPLAGLDPVTGQPRIRITVSDTGAGIPAGRMDDVFVPFERLGAETSEVEGTGLGLSVTKTLVEAMGGEIGVGSVQGIGTTFYVDLPAA